MSIDVLVVDDDEDMRETLEELLVGERYVVAKLKDGRLLVDVVKALDPRLVLLDLTMPGFDPQAAAAQLAAEGYLRRTTVFVLSGLDEVELRARALGFHGGLLKPFDIDVLLARVHAVCRPDGDASSPAHP